MFALQLSQNVMECRSKCNYSRTRHIQPRDNQPRDPWIISSEISYELGAYLENSATKLLALGSLLLQTTGLRLSAF